MKNTVMVATAMTSSVLSQPPPTARVGPPPPKLERPRARRKAWSMCCRAAVVTGDEVDDSTEMDVAVDGKGGGMWVARNM